MKVSHVRQEEPFGCAVAALAMVTGKSYAEVRAAFVGHDFSTSTSDIHTSGISHNSVDAYLSSQGYAVRRECRYDQVLNRPREVWPVEPFTDVHICEVVTSAGHSVVMLRDGTVLDPNRAEPRSLGDYAAVIYIAGVYKVD